MMSGKGSCLDGRLLTPKIIHLVLNGAVHANAVEDMPPELSQCERVLSYTDSATLSEEATFVQRQPLEEVDEVEILEVFLLRLFL